MESVEKGSEQSSKMKSYDDDDKAIDFRKLERELDSAVQAEAKYWRENDAKFRAVHQKVASYDEFKDIVKASHLKPLEEGDRLSNITFVQPWNTQASKQENKGNKPETGEIPKGKDYPTTGQTFIREWRKLNKNTSEQYKYLLELGSDRLGQIFKPEIGFGLLGEFAHCLQCELDEASTNDVIHILVKLSETNRFKLTVDFLSKKEKEDIVRVFENLTNCVNKVDCGEDEISVLKNLKVVYGVEK